MCNVTYLDDASRGDARGCGTAACIPIHGDRDMAGKSRQATTRQIDALAVLKQLNPDDIQQRVDELEKELRALRVLLRAVRPDAMPSSNRSTT